MDRVSVIVRIPALANDYDFLIPDSMAVQDVIRLIVRILESEYGINGSIKHLMLYAEDGTVLRNESSLKQMGVSDGSRLVLM